MDAFLGRTRHLGAIRAFLDEAGPSLIHVTGARGSGRSTLTRRAVEPFPAIEHTAPPLPDPDQRAALAQSLRHGLRALNRPVPENLVAAADWPTLVDALAQTPGRLPPPVLVLDDAHNLAHARSRFEAALAARIVDGDEDVKVVLVGGPRPAVTTSTVAVGPLPFRAASPLLPGSTASDRLRSYAVFGGLPGTLCHVDARTSLAANLRRALLAPDAPLAERGLDLLERDVQVPSRYAAILRGLSKGEQDWGGIQSSVADLTTSGQVAPYVKRLEDMGLLEVRRTLDATPRSRRRRYRSADPFLAFWYRFILPSRHRIARGEGPGLLTSLIRPDLDAHVASVFPEVCRQYVRFDARGDLGATAREWGALWGSGYEIAVAGILTSGAAFFGSAAWAGYAAGDRPLESLDRQIREARYAFGRERRLRLLFTGRPVSRALEREVARRDDAFLVGPDTLAGDD